MKVLIVDDEEHVREGIDLSVDWDRFGIKERWMAEDGVEALQMVRKHRPQIIFCDMKMPRMNGIDFMEKLKEEEGSAKIIAISGFDDFEYTRAVIKAKGVDYILKPFRKKDVELALKKAIDAWNEMESRKSTEFETTYLAKKADTLIDEQRLVAFFRGETNYSDRISGIFEKLDIPTEEFRVAVLLPKNGQKIVVNRFISDNELFFFAVKNIAQDILHAYGKHHLSRLDEYQWILIFSFEPAARYTVEFNNLLERVSRAWMNTIQLDVLAGTAKQNCTVKTISNSITNAKDSLLKSEILFPQKVEAVKNQPEMNHLTSQEFLLTKAIETSNKPFVEEIISRFVKDLKKRGTLQLKQLQIYTLEANILLERFKQAYEMNAHSVDKHVPPLPMWISSLNEWEVLFVQRIWMLMEKTSFNPMAGVAMRDIKHYIENHFHEEISLTSLSQRFHLSPQYISRKFKEEYNTSVIAYLIELKMEKAKSLLANTSLTITEIANDLGYEDENYFGKVFKKQSGLSPKQYRKLN
jgi:two-component system response regulator YesN